MKKFNLHTIKVGVFTMGSRLLGLQRDRMIFSLLGSNWISDAYVTAFRIPNMLRDLLGEGALSSVVVARLGEVKGQDEKRIKPLFQSLIGFWGVVLIFATLLGMLLAPLLLKIMVPGFAGNDEQVELTIFMLRFLFPYIFLVGMSALSMSALHHVREFGWASSASIFFNITVIVATYLGSLYCGLKPQKMIIAIGAALLLGGLVQWGSQVPKAIKAGFSFFPSFDWRDPEIKKIYQLIIPSIISVAAVQINIIINSRIASEIYEGALTSLQVAFRIMQLPVGVVGVAVSTVLLPTLTQYYVEKKNKDFGDELSAALVSVCFLTLPAIGGLYVLNYEILAVIFGYGEFTEKNVLEASLALQGYLFAIAPYAWNKSLMQGYFSRSDTKYPLIVSFSSILVNWALNSTLVYVFDLGVLGLAFGTGCVLMMNCFLMIAGLRWKHKVVFPILPMLKHIFIMLIWTLVMVASLYHIKSLFPENDELKVVALVPLGGAIYFSVWMLFKRMFKKDYRSLAESL